MEGLEKNRKGWGYLIIRKALALLPYAIKLLYLLACIGLIMLGTDMLETYGGEMKALVDSGDIPECMYYYPAAFFMILIGAGLMVLKFKRS